MPSRSPAARSSDSRRPSSAGRTRPTAGTAMRASTVAATCQRSDSADGTGATRE